MGSVLFWNVAKRDVRGELTQIVKTFMPDIFLLAESTFSSGSILEALNSELLGAYIYFSQPNPRSKIQWFSRLPENNVIQLFDEGIVAGAKVRFFDKPPILLCGVHLPSKLNENEAEHLMTSQSVVELVSRAEHEFDSPGTVIIGDFNMNPFDLGMSAVNGFNAVMDLSIARKKTIVYKGNKYRYFYNPMWSRLGDQSDGPPGTHFFPKRQLRYHWNTYDQVIFSGHTLDFVEQAEICVIDVLYRNLNTKFEFKTGKSDHFPIFVSI